MKKKISPTAILAISSLIIFFFFVFLFLILNVTGSIDNHFYIDFSVVMALVSAFSLLLVFFAELISFFIIKKTRLESAFIALGILLTILLSRDVALILDLFGASSFFNEEWIRILFLNLNFTTFILTDFIFYRYINKEYKVLTYKFERIASLIILIVLYLSFIGLSFINLEIIAYSLFSILMIYWLFRITTYIHRSQKHNLNFAIYYLMFSLLQIAETIFLISRISSLHYRSTGVFAFTGVLCFLCFSTIYLFFIINLSKNAAKKEEFERKINELQLNILKNQMKPHFIFNALNIIKALYMVDIDKGNEAVDLLSKYLRSMVEAGDTFLVPLTKELDVVEHYLELENLKIKSPFNIIYNIDTYDFDVPYFSIQPLIENIVRYSLINEKEDGYAEIKTSEEGDFYLLVISDNGVGFDISKIKNDSYGIKNSKERFVLLLDASFEIISSKGEGTNIEIKIPKKGKKG